MHFFVSKVDANLEMTMEITKDGALKDEASNQPESIHEVCNILELCSWVSCRI